VLAPSASSASPTSLSFSRAFYPAVSETPDRGLFCSPIKPNPAAFWLSPRHAELGLARSRRHNRAVNKPFSWGTVRALAKNKGHVALAIAVPAMYVSTLLATSASSYFGVFLKSLVREDGTKVWSVAAVNLVPTIGSASAFRWRSPNPAVLGG
jgi:hypothetical protein